jgi:putative inorganic carbon (HCO3(-)) transporter
VSAEPLELVGLLVACGAAAAAILFPRAGWQPWAMAIALMAAPLLVLGDVWDQPRITDARESPALVAAAALTAAATVAVGAAVVRRWDWAFPALVFAVIALRLPIRIGGETSNLLIPLYLVIASGLVATVWDRLRGGGEAPDGARGPAAGAEPSSVTWLRRALAATLVLYAVQAAYSDDVSNAIENAGFFLVPFAVLFCQLAAVLWSERVLARVAFAVGAVGVGLALLAVGQYLARDLIFNEDLLDSNQIKPFFRVNSLFHDPNVLGRYLAVGVIGLGAAVAWSRGGRAAVAATAAAVVMLVGLTLSFSITSAAALLAGVAVVAVLRYGLRGGIASAAAILLTGVVFAVTGGADRSDIGPSRGFGEETSGRVNLLEGGWELIEREPVTGWGSGAFGRVFFDEIRETETTTSHSEPITVAAEQGVLGFALYLALLGTVLWVLFGAGVTASAARAAAAAGIVALVIHSVGYAGFTIDAATWALLGLAVGVRATGSASRRHPPATEATPSTPAA